MIISLVIGHLGGVQRWLIIIMISGMMRLSIEGASQRVQEDTLKFARIMEGLGAELLRSLMTLIAFTPILWGLSKSITVLPWIGEVEHALVWVAILSALGGTILLASVGIKLPGIEYDIQKEEAALQKRISFR